MGAVSGTQSAYYVIDFSVIGFGVGAAREGLALQLDGQQSIRVAARTTVDLGSTGFVAFRLKDQDGTVVRTADADLFSIGTSFTTISQTINNLTVVDESGSTPGLNLQQIQSVGLIFFDRGFSATSTMVFDNLAITSVPEPSSIVLAIAATSIGLAARWRKRNAQT